MATIKEGNHEQPLNSKGREISFFIPDRTTNINLGIFIEEIVTKDTLKQVLPKKRIKHVFATVYYQI